MRTIKLIVVHTSATLPHQDIGVKEIDKMHKAKGWDGIGYHTVIRKNGTLEHGRDLTEVGAHVYGYNRNSIGICMVGGVDSNNKAENNYSPEQFATLKGYIDTLKDLFTEAKVLGHRDLSPDIDGDGIIEPFEWLKQCPCFDVREWYYGE